MTKSVQSLCAIAIVVLTFYSASADGKKKEVKCSEFCVCDIYQRLRRATCQNKRLTTMEIDMTPEVQILDMSYNQVSELDGMFFSVHQLSDLKLLNLSHNKISQIHLHAFDGLSELKTLDLSYNAIRYFIRLWFLDLGTLEELYLRGNPLRTINEQPRIEIKSLRILDLSDCKIAHLVPDVFSMMPNLKSLNLSSNFLTGFRLDTIKPLKQLSVLNLVGNTFSCNDRSTRDLKKYTRRKGILLRDSCKSHSPESKSKMFEKMIMQPNKDVSDVERNSWIYDDEEHVKIIEVCNNSTNNTNRTGIEGFIMDVVELYPLITLPALFGSGILIGVAFGCICGCLCRRKKREFRNNDDDEPDEPFKFRRSTRSLMSHGNNSLNYKQINRHRDEIRNLVMNELDFSNSTPVYTRKNYVS